MIDETQARKGARRAWALGLLIGIAVMLALGGLISATTFLSGVTTTGEIALTELASGQQASAGYVHLYAKSGHLYSQDSAGVEWNLDAVYPHATTHQAGQIDEIDVTGLLGLLGTKQDAAKLQGRALSDTAPTDGQGIAWDDGNSTWKPADVNAVLLQGRDVVSTAPDNGDALVWNDGDSQWEPGAVAGGAHDLLSATHTDTTAAAVTQGAVIIGAGATPKWAALAVGTVGQVLTTDGTDVSWEDPTGGGASAFTDLTDAPADYTGSAGKFVRVDSTPDALEFGTIADGDIPSGITRDSEWDTQGEVETIWGTTLATDGELSNHTGDSSDPHGATLTQTNEDINGTLRILEAGATPTLYGTLAVDDLTSTGKTYTFPNATGTVITTGNLTDITAVGTVSSGAIADAAISSAATWSGKPSLVAAGSNGTAAANAGDDTTAARSDHEHYEYRYLTFVVPGTIGSGDPGVWIRIEDAGAAGDIISAYAVLGTAGSTATTVDILTCSQTNIDGTPTWTTIFTNKLLLDANERSTNTASTAASLNVTSWTANDHFRLNVDTAGTSAANLTVTLKIRCKNKAS